MTTLYLVRHGQTDNNLHGSFNGCQTDQPLNETGKKQAYALRDAFADKPLDAIYSSPLVRAVMTAEGVRGTRDMPIHTVYDLREMDMGILDGVTFEKTKRDYAEVWHNWQKDPEKLRMPDGESFMEAQERAFAALLDILHRERGRAVAVVAHGTLISLLTAKLFGLPLIQRRRVPYLPNVGYHELSFDDKGYFSPVHLRVIAHIPEELHLSPPEEIDKDAWRGTYPVPVAKEL